MLHASVSLKIIERCDKIYNIIYDHHTTYYFLFEFYHFA